MSRVPADCFAVKPTIRRAERGGQQNAHLAVGTADGLHTTSEESNRDHIYSTRNPSGERRKSRWEERIGPEADAGFIAFVKRLGRTVEAFGEIIDVVEFSEQEQNRIVDAFTEIANVMRDHGTRVNGYRDGIVEAMSMTESHEWFERVKQTFRRPL